MPRRVPPNTQTPPGTAATARPEDRKARVRACAPRTTAPAAGRESQPPEAANAGLASTRICSARNGPSAAAPRASRQPIAGASTAGVRSCRTRAVAPAPTRSRHASQARTPPRTAGSQVPKASRSAVSAVSPPTTATAKPVPDSPRAVSYSAVRASMANAAPAKASQSVGDRACMPRRTASRPPTPATSSPRGPATARATGARKPARQTTMIVAEAPRASVVAAKCPNEGNAARSTSESTAMVTAMRKTRESSWGTTGGPAGAAGPPGRARESESTIMRVFYPCLFLVAGQLLAQCRERLVGGQRAAASRVAAPPTGLVAPGGVGLRSGRLGLGLAGFFDLLLVRVETGTRLRVLPLPRLTLLVEALEPVAGLGVEALGVLVVALGVVLGRHAVERRVELLVGERPATLVGLLQREADAAPVEVDVDDL